MIADVRLPKAVKAAEERSDALIKKANEDEPGNRAALGRPDNSNVVDLGTLKNDPVSKEDFEALRSKFETLNSQHNVLKGKYNKEVELVLGGITAEDIEGLKNQVTELTTQLQEAKNKPADKSYLEGIAEDYSGPLAEGFEKQHLFIEEQRQTIAILQGQVSSLTSDMQNMGVRVSAAEHTSTTITSNAFFDELVNDIKDFKVINDSNEFAEWLDNKIEPVSSKSYRNLLQDAASRLDTTAAKAIFDKYIQKIAKPTDRREALLSPNVSTANVLGQEGEKFWKRTEIAQFYKDVTLGKYKGREKEEEEVGKEIFDAQQSNRIIDDLTRQ